MGKRTASAKPSRLDERDRRFIEEVLRDPDRDGSATKAAIRAGFSAKSAGQRAYELLQREDVQEEINRRRRRAMDATDASVEWIAGEMVLHAAFDPAELVAVPSLDGDGQPLLDDDGRPIMEPITCPADIARLPAHVRRVIKGWKWSQSGRFSLILVDRQTAIDQLAKWRQMYVTRSEHTGPGGGPIQTEDLSGLPPEERAARIAELLAKREAADSDGADGARGG